MTGYTVNTGTNQKFSTGWDKIFTKGIAKKGDKKKDEPLELKKTGSSIPPIKGRKK